MIVKVESARFGDQPLTFRSFLGTDIVAEVDGLRAGWILNGTLNGGPVWWWTMTGPCCAHGRIASHGQSRSLEEAKEQFRQAFEKWRQWALFEDQPVTWFGAAYPAPESSFLPKHP